MGKTADLTVVQKPIIDTLHKEGKPQTFIAKEAGCSQSAVSKHVNRELSGRKNCGRKRCTTNRENRSLMRIVKQNRFKNLCELHKEWTEAGVKASRATTHRRVKEFETRVWRKGGEAHSLSCLKSSVKFPHSVMIWDIMSSAVLVHCVFWKPTSLHPFTKKFWSASCFLLLTSFLKMLISFSSRIWHLSTLPKAPKVG